MIVPWVNICSDAPVSATVDELRWTGPPDTAAFASLCAKLDADRLVARAAELTPA